VTQLEFRRCDVIVIGGGIAGAGAAYELAGAAEVVLLERESQCGYHATGRSAASFTENYGSAVIRRLALASRPFLEAPPEGFAEHSLLSPRGIVTIARSDQIEALEQELERAQKFVPEIRRIGREEALARVPALRPDYVADAILEPDAQDIDVHGLHQGYLKGLRSRGGRIFTDAEVGSIAHSAGLWRLETRAGSFETRILVNAAGAWADELARRAGVPPLGLTPMRRTVFMIDAPEALAIAAWPMINDVQETFYFKPDAGQLLISPADAEPSLPGDAQAEEYEVALGVDRLQRATTLPVPRVKHKWAGLRTFAPDRNPVAGEDRRAGGFFWLAGQGGYGIKTAPALSRIIAALVLGRDLPEAIAQRDVSPASLSPGRFEDAPYPGKNPP
jgi:D-arginine dehydrogenase